MMGATGTGPVADLPSSGRDLPAPRDPCTIADFERVDIRVGLILAAAPLAGARKPAYKLTIDFGPLGIKQSSAQLTARYTAEELVGRRVLGVVNFPPRRIAGFASEVLTLGVPDAQGNVTLVRPDDEVPLGSQLF